LLLHPSNCKNHNLQPQFLVVNCPAATNIITIVADTGSALKTAPLSQPFLTRTHQLLVVCHLKHSSFIGISAIFVQEIFTAKSEKDTIVAQLPNRVHVGHVNARIALLSTFTAKGTALGGGVTNVTACHNYGSGQVERVLAKQITQVSFDLVVSLNIQQLCMYRKRGCQVSTRSQNGLANTSNINETY
jgi:hypothetical protein